MIWNDVCFQCGEEDCINCVMAELQVDDRISAPVRETLD